VLLLIWAVVSFRSRSSPMRALFALAAVVPLTILVTYHRAYDAKLLLLTVPACAILWAEGASIRWLALIISTCGIVMTGEIPLAVLVYFTNGLHIGSAGFFGQMLRVVVTRPGSLALLAMAIFYLWVYVQRSANNKQKGSETTDDLAAAVGQRAREPFNLRNGVLFCSAPDEYCRKPNEAN
jgi:hypothetical protein